MAGVNNLPGYGNVSQDALLEALGTTKFYGTYGTGWVHIVNGLMFQGGSFDISVPGQAIPFNVPFTKQVFSVHLTPRSTDDGFAVVQMTLQNFNLVKQKEPWGGFYWLAIGV